MCSHDPGTPAPVPSTMLASSSSSGVEHVIRRESRSVQSPLLRMEFSVVLRGGAGLEEGMVLPYPEEEYTRVLNESLVQARDCLLKVNLKPAESFIIQSFIQSCNLAALTFLDCRAAVRSRLLLLQ